MVSRLNSRLVSAYAVELLKRAEQHTGQHTQLGCEEPFAPHACTQRNSGDVRTAGVVARIALEERAHVAVGVAWFQRVCGALGVAAPELYRRWLLHLSPEVLKVGGDARIDAAGDTPTRLVPSWHKWVLRCILFAYCLQGGDRTPQYVYLTAGQLRCRHVDLSVLHKGAHIMHLPQSPMHACLFQNTKIRPVLPQRGVGVLHCWMNGMLLQRKCWACVRCCDMFDVQYRI